MMIRDLQVFESAEATWSTWSIKARRKKTELVASKETVYVIKNFKLRSIFNQTWSGFCGQTIIASFATASTHHLFSQSLSSMSQYLTGKLCLSIEGHSHAGTPHLLEGNLEYFSHCAASHSKVGVTISCHCAARPMSA
jgi:hypothetical protein